MCQGGEGRMEVAVGNRRRHNFLRVIVAERLEIDVEEGSRRLVVTKKILAGIESQMEKHDTISDKEKLIKELSGFLNGDMPDLEDKTASKDATENKAGEQNSSSKVSVQIDKLKRDFKIHGTVGADSSKDSPVYVLRPESGRGRDRTLHRNLLLPCSYLPVEQPDIQRDVRPRSVAERPPLDGDESSDSSDDEELPTFTMYLAQEDNTPHDSFNDEQIETESTPEDTEELQPQDNDEARHQDNDDTTVNSDESTQGRPRRDRGPPSVFTFLAPGIEPSVP